MSLGFFIYSRLKDPKGRFNGNIRSYAPGAGRPGSERIRSEQGLVRELACRIYPAAITAARAAAGAPCKSWFGRARLQAGLVRLEVGLHSKQAWPLLEQDEGGAALPTRARVGLQHRVVSAQVSAAAGAAPLHVAQQLPRGPPVAVQ